MALSKQHVRTAVLRASDLRALPGDAQRDKTQPQGGLGQKAKGMFGRTAAGARLWPIALCKRSCIGPCSLTLAGRTLSTWALVGGGAE